MTSIKQMEVFALVADLGSFTKAAAALYMTQPAVSWQIKSLEEQLGLPLIYRKERSLELSEAGRVFHAYCQEILAIYQRAQSAMSEFNGLGRGALMVGCSTIPGEYILPPLITSFVYENPGINVQIAVSSTGQMMSKLTTGAIDLAVVGALIPNPSVDFIPWLSDQIVIVAASSNPVTAHLEWEDFVSLPQISRQADSGSRMVVEQELASHGYNMSECNIVMELSSTQSVISAVLGGNCLAFVSNWAAKPHLEDGRLKEIKLANINIGRSFYIAVWQSRYMSKVTKSCLEFLQNSV